MRYLRISSNKKELLPLLDLIIKETFTAKNLASQAWRYMWIVG